MAEIKWTYDEKRKKVVDPEGNTPTGKELVNVLNNATKALSIVYDASFQIADGLSVIEAVFFGSVAEVDGEQVADEEVDDTGTE